MDENGTKKPRRKLTLKDRLADLDARIARNAAEGAKLAAQRTALIEGERERIKAASAALAQASGG